MEQQTKTITGDQCRRAATLFNLGNIIAIAIPFPLLIFWFGASMVIYAMNRHHPNEKVGHYTQQAAYRFYFITGFLVVIGTFIPGGREGLVYYAALWASGIAIMVPWSLWDILKIRRDVWQPCEITVDNVEDEYDRH